MALKAMVDSLDEIPEAVRGEYEEVDGKFRLSVEGVDSLVDNSGIKQALEKERAKGKLVDAIRKEFPAASDDDIRELVKKAKGLKKGEGGEPLDNEKLVLKLRKEIDDEYAPIKSENEQLKGELRTIRLDDQVRKAALEAGIISEDIEDVLTLTRANFDLDAKNRVVVLDEDGDPSTVTLQKFFTDVFKKRKPKFYKAPDVEGGNAGGGRRPSGGKTDAADLSKLSATERLAEHRRRQAKK